MATTSMGAFARPFNTAVGMPCIRCAYVVALLVLLGIGSVSAQPAVGSNQVATQVTPSPGKNYQVYQMEYQSCTQLAAGNVTTFVRCMLQRGNSVRVVGPGGVELNAAQFAGLASAPTQVPPPAVPQYQPTVTANRVPSPPPVASEESIKYANLLDRLVAQDSKSWAANQYNRGSMRNVTVVRSSDGKSRIIKGDYTFNNREQGWVEARFVGNRLSCLHYWDRSDCRSIGEGAGKALERAAAAAAREQQLHPRPTTSSSSSGPSWFTCNHVLGGAPMIAGMAGCSPW
jgi:hypothetical protein